MPGAKRETTYFRRRSEQAWRKSEWVGQWDSGSRGHGQVYHAVPSPANLHASCPKSLADGRYRWRHDQVLKAVAESIALAISTTKHHRALKKAISFIKAGEKPRAGPQITTGLLHTAPDWQLHVDLGKQLIFPSHIITSLRPDMIIISEASKHLIMLELTVPWEERVEEANERKHAKYQELVEECRGRGWRTFYEPIEVGCRGFAGCSLCKVFGRLGVTGTAKKRAIKSASEAAEKATRGGGGLKGQIRGLLLGHKPGLDHPSWVAWARVYDVVRPETPYEPRIHPDDVSQCIQEM
ncbi:hypothetical protein D4764_06G0013950 [Takifugu flavidus]|uniref:Uncharacterized protein n=1 Tax=Takifugu flavidus TaxID=433684 RepID=A0A5C6MYC7_9TELE|nr:hypothetical protein D4764_06G0013950 [Takifugu flavidus]